MLYSSNPISSWEIRKVSKNRIGCINEVIENDNNICYESQFNSSIKSNYNHIIDMNYFIRHSSILTSYFKELYLII